MSVSKTAREFMKLVKSDASNERDARFISEEDTANILRGLSIVERLYPDQVLMLCNRSHPKLQYVGANCPTVFGYSQKEFAALTVEDFFKGVHPDDLSQLMQCLACINAAEPYHPASHRFVLTYRFRNKGGHYLHLRDEKLAIRDEDGKYIYFSLFKDIARDEKFYNVKLEIYEQGKINMQKVYTYHPGAGRAMTSRQNEIMKLITRGFSTQEIADRLNVSTNTIRNHKQVLFRKANVKSSVELIDFARRR